MKDVLLWAHGEPPKPGPRRIGIHTSTSGGVQMAAERAYRLGANTFQIFSSSPRQWKPYGLLKAQCEEMARLREKYGISPLVIHTSYLVNLASATPVFHGKSVEAFRGELQRAMALGANFLVLHPGSFRGRSREEGLALVAHSIAEAAEGMDLEKAGLKVLIENTAGAEFSLGGSFEQVAHLLEYLRPVCPVGACIDTCHTHVSGYDIVSGTGSEQTMRQLDETIGLKNVLVWHCNDARDARGSKRDRHEHIGKGTIGLEPFRRLLNDARTEHAAFIAETPIDEPQDDFRNVERLRELVQAADIPPKTKRA
ncbi:MAG TPA: deoxyribonuclease IV [Candidatus Limnocylindrales bacterium]|nr:deoxyribonuclease IV [Candidatus Limnocylindrales bacterium]